MLNANEFTSMDSGFIPMELRWLEKKFMEIVENYTRALTGEAAGRKGLPPALWLWLAGKESINFWLVGTSAISIELGD